MARVIAFDVNETLLDLGALDPLFERAFGRAELRAQWFGQMLQLAFAGGLTGPLRGLHERPARARWRCSRRRRTCGSTRTTRRRSSTPCGGCRRTPTPPPALDRLRGAGLTLAALTNSPLDVARDQLTSAGLADRFHAILSADQVQALKPLPEPYRLVARTFDVPLAEVRLVAAHAWDVSGALAAGCAAAFVRRPGKVPSPLGPQPDITGDGLLEVAERIVAADAPARR